MSVISLLHLISFPTCTPTHVPQSWDDKIYNKKKNPKNKATIRDGHVSILFFFCSLNPQGRRHRQKTFYYNFLILLRHLVLLSVTRCIYFLSLSFLVNPVKSFEFWRGLTQEIHSKFSSLGFHRKREVRTMSTLDRQVWLIPPFKKERSHVMGRESFRPYVTKTTMYGPRESWDWSVGFWFYQGVGDWECIFWQVANWSYQGRLLNNYSEYVMPKLPVGA